MFGLFKKDDCLDPLDCLERIEQVLLPIQQEKFHFRGVLLPKDNRKSYTTYFFKMAEAFTETSEEPNQSDIDLSKVTLQVFERASSTAKLEEAVFHEVILEGRIEVRIWKDSGTASVSIIEPRLIKKVRPIEIQNDACLEELIELYRKNPANKPRGEEVIVTLADKIKRNGKISVLVIGPKGKGRDDILTEFSRAEGLENFVQLYTLDLSLNPPTLYVNQTKKHFQNLSKVLKEQSDSGNYDLITLARGGGDPYSLASLNNEDFCSEVIRSKTPVCVSIAHSSDDLWLKQTADIYTNVPALLITELSRAVNSVYPGAVKVEAMQKIESTAVRKSRMGTTLALIALLLLVIAVVYWLSQKYFF